MNKFEAYQQAARDAKERAKELEIRRGVFKLGPRSDGDGVYITRTDNRHEGTVNGFSRLNNDDALNIVDCLIEAFGLPFERSTVFVPMKPVIAANRETRE